MRRMNRGVLLGVGRALLVFASLTLTSAPAWAVDLSLRLEGGGSAPISAPQSAYYGPGVGLAANFLLGIASALDVGVSVGYSLWPQRNGGVMTQPSSFIRAGAALRLKRPLTNALVIPWLDAGPFYTRTGGVNTLGVSGGLGVLFRTSVTSSFLFGPSARYERVFALAPEAGFASRDADLITIGISVEFLLGDRAAPEAADGVDKVKDTDADGLIDTVDRCPDKAGPAFLGGCPDSDGDGVNDLDDRCPKQVGPASNGGCPDAPKVDLTADGDADGVPDVKDACPTVPGLPEAAGCPKYRQIVVTEEKIELRQKIFFSYGNTKIMPRSFMVLDEVVQALSDRKKACLRIEGHTDDRGNAEQNQELSQGRATAVRQYLVDHGTDGNRLVAKGFGESLPMDDNRSAAGRENNRRVEFVIVPCPP